MDKWNQEVGRGLVKREVFSRSCALPRRWTFEPRRGLSTWGQSCNFSLNYRSCMTYWPVGNRGDLSASLRKDHFFSGYEGPISKFGGCWRKISFLLARPTS